MLCSITKLQVLFFIFAIVHVAVASFSSVIDVSQGTKISGLNHTSGLGHSQKPKTSSLRNAFRADTVLPFGRRNIETANAFRADTTLRFMRGISTQNPRKAEGTTEASMKDLQKGPQYNSKRAQESASKVHNQQTPTEEKEGSDPLEAIGDAGAAVGGAISDAVKDVQKGPNYDKGAQKKDGRVDNDKDRAEEKRFLDRLQPDRQSSDTEKVEEALEDKESGCKNLPQGWTDTRGNTCEDYREGEFCTRHGGYGDAWLDEWGSFEDVASKGKTAKEVCCVCGGGDHEDSNDLTPDGDASSPDDAAPAPSFRGPILGSKSGKPLQEQGYSGDLVAHEDQKTMTDDWGLEFGPRAGHRNLRSICQDHPDNEWCFLHGYHQEPEVKSASRQMKCSALAFITFFVACLQ